MDSAIVTRPSPARVPNAAAAPSTVRRRRHRLAPRRRGRAPVHLVLLAGLLVLSLALRLWGIKQGLPYSYNSDEATHFVPRAVAFLGGDLNPHYFLNPPAYTYLLYVVLMVWFGGGQALHHAFQTDPTAVYVVARALAGLLGTAAVALTYVAGSRMFGRWAGLAGAAVLGLAFLPVFYSHLALNDAPTLAPVALSLVGVAGVVRRVRGGGQVARRTAPDYLVAGLGAGLAAATKYTGGVVLLCLLVAWAWDALQGAKPRVAAGRLALAVGVSLIAFLAADPYALLDHHAFISSLSYQSSAVGTTKLGANPSNGWVYYLWTFTWGLGWVPALAGLAGGILLVARRRFMEALVLLPTIVLYIVYMGAQQRYFGRWLMPAFPLAALLAGYAAAQVGRGSARLRRVGRAGRWTLGGVGVALLVAQSVASDIHVDLVLSRPDTRNLARAWMVGHIARGSGVVIEPIVPANWGSRWRQYPTYLARLPDGAPRPIHVDQYESYLRPALLADYLSRGYCWVVSGSQQSERAFVDPAAARGAVAYYAALARRARVVHRVSPYAPGAQPAGFNYDLSFDYYPEQFRLPGPAITIYRLRGGRCGAG